MANSVVMPRPRPIILLLGLLLCLELSWAGQPDIGVVEGEAAVDGDGVEDEGVEPPMSQPDIGVAEGEAAVGGDGVVDEGVEPPTNAEASMDGHGLGAEAFESPPTWMDEEFMKEEAAAKAAAAELAEEADRAHEEVKKAAVKAAQARIKAEEAQKKLAADMEKKMEKHRGKAPQPLAPPTAPEGSSCGPQGCKGHARLLSKESESAPASVTLLTLSSDSDLMPLELMLPHQVVQSSKDGRERFERVLVLKMPASPHHSELQPGALPFSIVPLRSIGERDGADEVIQLDTETLKDQAFFRRFLVGGGKHPAKSLHDLWQSASEEPEASDSQEAPLGDGEHAPPLVMASADDEGIFHSSTTTLGLLKAIEQCNTTYCAFIEPDVFVHRHTDQPGWIDRAVDLMEADSNLVVVQAAKIRGSETKGSCSTAQSEDGSFSQRSFVINKRRLRQFLPIRVDCAPSCDTFEALFVLPTSAVGLMSCSSTASWVIHPPEDETAMLRLFEGCAHAAGRGAEMQAPAKSPAGGRRLQRDLSNVPLPALPKEVEGDDHVLKMHRRLATSSWIGLPEFLDYISTATDFGEAETISVGEQMGEELRGWTCPKAPASETLNYL